MKILDRLKATVPYLLFFFIGLIVSMVTLDYCVLTLKLGMVSSIGLQTIATTACLLPLVLGYLWLKIKRRKAENKKVMAQKIAEAEAMGEAKYFSEEKARAQKLKEQKDLTPPPDPLREYPDETPPLQPEIRYGFHNPRLSDEDFEKLKQAHPDLLWDLGHCKPSLVKSVLLARIQAKQMAERLQEGLEHICSWDELKKMLEFMKKDLDDSEELYFRTID